jgi:glucose-6-phosphate 1-epimerase
MDRIELTSAHGRAVVTRRGAQVLETILDGYPLLWLSAHAPAAGAPIRGGIPVCFPWFGRHPAGFPAHGFARITDWQPVEQSTDRIVYALDDTEHTRTMWPHHFHAELAVRVDDALTLDFTVDNTGAVPFRFTYALHSYLAVDALSASVVDGLDGRVRIDDGRRTTQDGPVRLDRSIDAIFEESGDRLTLREGARRTTVDADGMTSAVIWNPGTNTILDLGEDWRGFVCVERGRVGAAEVALAPGERHQASMRLGRG